MRLGKLKYFGIAIVMLATALLYVASRPSRPRGCVLEKVGPTVSTVTYGCFVEFIPRTGVVEVNPIDLCHNIKVPIDELYLSRIEPGLKATTTVNNKDYELSITNVYHAVENGRFEIDMNFCDKIPPRILSGMTLRLRIELGKSSDELLLPVGGFYKDTGGKWIYVVRDGFAVRRNIKLGRKAGAEYFEVLDGLKAGDEVITSSYENFDQADVLDIAELEKRIHL